MTGRAESGKKSKSVAVQTKTDNVSYENRKSSRLAKVSPLILIKRGEIDRLELD